MITRWGKALAEQTPLPEYPRPQLARESYLNLNGRWEYAITATDEPPMAWDGDIRVPFSPESELSGVGRTLNPGETLWYARPLELPEGFRKARVLLHFGAVDQDATVYLNGTEVGAHQGGYNAFTVELTQALRDSGNRLMVKVKDDTDATWRTRGKQKRERGGIWYTPQSGIWQTVWLEPVPEKYIENVKITPDIDKNIIGVETFINQATASDRIEVKVMEGSRVVATGQSINNQPVEVSMPANPRLWSPNDPF